MDFAIHLIEGNNCGSSSAVWPASLPDVHPFSYSGNNKSMQNWYHCSTTLFSSTGMGFTLWIRTLDFALTRHNITST